MNHALDLSCATMLLNMWIWQTGLNKFQMLSRRSNFRTSWKSSFVSFCGCSLDNFECGNVVKIWKGCIINLLSLRLFKFNSWVILLAFATCFFFCGSPIKIPWISAQHGKRDIPPASIFPPETVAEEKYRHFGSLSGAKREGSLLSSGDYHGEAAAESFFFPQRWKRPFLAPCLFVEFKSGEIWDSGLESDCWFAENKT